MPTVIFLTFLMHCLCSDVILQPLAYSKRSADGVIIVNEEAVSWACRLAGGVEQGSSGELAPVEAIMLRGSVLLFSGLMPEVETIMPHGHHDLLDQPCVLIHRHCSVRGDEAAPARVFSGRGVCVPHQHPELGKQLGEVGMAEITPVIVKAQAVDMLDVGEAPSRFAAGNIRIKVGWADQEVVLLISHNAGMGFPEQVDEGFEASGLAGTKESD